MADDDKSDPTSYPTPPWAPTLSLGLVLPLVVLTAGMSAIVIFTNSGSKKNLFAFITTQVALCDSLMTCGPLVFFILLVTGLVDSHPTESHNYGCLVAVIFSYTISSISACMLPLYILASYYRIYYMNTSWYQTQITKKKLQFASHFMFLVVPVMTMYFLDLPTGPADNLCHRLLPSSFYGSTRFVLFCLVLAWMELVVCSFPIIRNSDVYSKIVCQVKNPHIVDRDLGTGIKNRSLAFETQKYMKFPIRFYKLRLDDIQEEEGSNCSNQHISTEALNRAWESSRTRLPMPGSRDRLQDGSFNKWSSSLGNSAENIQPKQETLRRRWAWWTSAEESHRMVLANVLELSSNSKNTPQDEGSSLSGESVQSRTNFLLNLLATNEGRSVADGLQPTILRSIASGDDINIQDLKDVSETSNDEDLDSRHNHHHPSSLLPKQSDTSDVCRSPPGERSPSTHHKVQIESADAVATSSEDAGKPSSQPVKTRSRSETHFRRLQQAVGKGSSTEVLLKPSEHNTANVRSNDNVKTVQASTTEETTARPVQKQQSAGSRRSFSTFEMRFMKRDSLTNHRSTKKATLSTMLVSNSVNDNFLSRSTESGVSDIDKAAATLNNTLSDSYICDEQTNSKKCIVLSSQSNHSQRESNKHGLDSQKGSHKHGIDSQKGSHKHGLESHRGSHKHGRDLDSGSRSTRSTQTSVQGATPVDSSGGTPADNNRGTSTAQAKGSSLADKPLSTYLDKGNADVNSYKTKQELSYQNKKEVPQLQNLTGIAISGRQNIPLSTDGLVPQNDFQSTVKRKNRKIPIIPQSGFQQSANNKKPPPGQLRMIIPKDLSSPGSSPLDIVRQKRRDRQAQLLSRIKNKTFRTQSINSRKSFEDLEKSFGDVSASNVTNCLKNNLKKDCNNPCTEEEQGAGDVPFCRAEIGKHVPNKNELRKAASSTSRHAPSGTCTTIGKRGWAAFWLLLTYVTVVTISWFPLTFYQFLYPSDVSLFIQPQLSLLLISWCRPLVSSSILLWSTYMEA